MPRPCKPRRIGQTPAAVHFKPQGVPLRQLDDIQLASDELEAMRLADLVGLSHEEVGARMAVSRATAGRILASARRKVAEALTRGKAIRIETIPAPETAENEARSEDMPGFDRTGPQGGGPRTGRRHGRCSNGQEDFPQAPRPGRGQGRGLGRRARGKGCGAGQGLGHGHGHGHGGQCDHDHEHGHDHDKKED
jgi:predicted DNA-binding protein (UPF0251 family)